MEFDYTLTMSDDRSPRQRAAETKRRRTRVALLDAATAVFSEHGWQARMEDVAQRAGIGAATAYNHFPSKVDLMMHTFARIMEPLQEKVNHDIAAKVDPTIATTRHITEIVHLLKTSYKSMTAAYLAAVADSASSGAIPMAFVLDHEIKKVLAPAAPEQPLADLISYGQRVGAFRADVSAWAIGSYHTYALLWLVSRGVVPPPMENSESYEQDLVLNQLLPVLKLKQD